jgi:hypothetical protein
MTISKYYVYVYLRVDGSPYYVGKGCNGRWKDIHKIEVPSADRVIFPITNTTEEWAHFMEMEFIDLHGRLNDGTGILENLTDGGEGQSGAIRSIETKRKLSEASKGNRSAKGRVATKETKLLLSKAKKGKKRKPFSEETKQKMSIAQKNRYRK